MAGLADPFSLGPLSLRNRLVATAHGTGLVRDGRALPGDADYWRRRAEGGIAMAIIGGTCVAPESQDRYGIVFEAFREDAVPDLRARADAIKAGGAVAVQQIVHLGRETLGSPTWYASVAPSAVRSPREPVAVRPLTLDEIGEVIQAFVRTSANVAEGGFDGVELHAAHGYLLAQFLSPEANTRTDRYGGDRAGRVRLLAETISGIRALDTGIAVGVRLSIEPGLDVEELAAITAVLGETARPDWLNITVGPRGEYVKDMATERPPLLGDFGPIREAAAATPLIVSHAFRARREIEDALAQGADLVGMARPLIADADFPRKLLEGRDAEIRPCVSCNEDCRLFTPALLCTVNPDLALPGEPRRRAKPLLVQGAEERDGGVVAIVGAGPAGARVRGDARARGTRRRGAVRGRRGARRRPRDCRSRAAPEGVAADPRFLVCRARIGPRRRPSRRESRCGGARLGDRGRRRDGKSRDAARRSRGSSRRSGHGSSSPPVRRGSRTPSASWSSTTASAGGPA